MSEDEGPPMSEDEGPPMNDETRPQRQYPDTPMPRHEEPFIETESNPFFGNAMLLFFVALAVGHFWTVRALQTDVNIVQMYQQEHIEQYKHMVRLLENMQQVKWQMVVAN